MLPPEVILAVYAAVMVITLLPIAPGGAGLPEVLYIGFFTNYVTDASWDDAIGAGVMLFRGMSWFLPIPVGYVALLFQRRGVRQEREAKAAAAPEADRGGLTRQKWVEQIGSSDGAQECVGEGECA